MFFLILAIIIMLIALFNYKKGFIAYIIYQIFWLYGGNLITLGDKSIVYSMGMTLYFAVLFFVKVKRLRPAKEKFPYKFCFLLLIVSALITPFYAVAGFDEEFTRAISNILQDIVIVWLLWNVIEREDDFKKIYKYITFVMFFACLFGFFEYIIKDNPFLNYKNVLMDGNINIYSLDFGRGYRICSLWEHPIGAGLGYSLYIVVTFYLFINKNKQMPIKYFALLTAILCIPCILLTKMRTAIVFLVIGALMFIDFRKRRFIKLFFVAILLFIVAIPLLGDYINVFLSLFDLGKLVSYSSTGSSLMQRLDQFEAVYQLMLLSPIGGLGELFKEYVVNRYTVAALSYESIWLEQMSKHGIVGVVANLVLMIYSVIVIPKKYKSKECFWLALSYWTIYTLTSIPSFRAIHYYLFMFYLIKTNKNYNKERLDVT